MRRLLVPSLAGLLAVAGSVLAAAPGSAAPRPAAAPHAQAAAARTAADAPTPSGVRLAFTRTGPAVNEPVAIVSPKDGTGRLFIVENTGRIKIWKPGWTSTLTYLDVSSLLDTDGERGLLGLAFSPDWQRYPYFWISYTNTSGTIVLARYRATNYYDNAVSASRRQYVGAALHPADATNHNGGQLFFGVDRLLYWSTGDGGSTPENAPRLNSLLGKILRVDALRACSGRLYCIPAGNRYAQQPGARGEIWLRGLRNPWKVSMDRTNGYVYVADVGQNSYEEVSVVPRTSGGVDLGWPCFEGTHRYAAGTSSCHGPDPQPYLNPRVEYDHSVGASITGGFVYRGARYRSILDGIYIYGDFASGNVWTYRYPGTSYLQGKLFPGSQVDGTGGVTSFGEDGGNEIWAVTYGNFGSANTGRIWQMSAAAR